MWLPGPGDHDDPRWGRSDDGDVHLGGYRLLVGPNAKDMGCPWPETFGWWECGPPLDPAAQITDPPFWWIDPVLERWSA